VVDRARAGSNASDADTCKGSIPSPPFLFGLDLPEAVRPSRKTPAGHATNGAALLPWTAEAKPLIAVSRGAGPAAASEPRRAQGRDADFTPRLVLQSVIRLDAVWAPKFGASVPR